MLSSEARELKQLREENARLKCVVADLTLEPNIRRPSEAMGALMAAGVVLPGLQDPSIY